jgi:transposase
LERKLGGGRESARALSRARVLLKCDEGYTDEEVVEAVGVSLGTVERSGKRFCVGGLEAVLKDRPHPPRPHKRKIDGVAEAHLVTLACSTPPDGRESWTLQLLADSMVKLKYIHAPISDETVRRALKKTRSSRGNRAGTE